jgi:hypothetical protein
LRREQLPRLVIPARPGLPRDLPGHANLRRAQMSGPRRLPRQAHSHSARRCRG